jgi:peptide methionine sulfoxide reductase MsrB
MMGCNDTETASGSCLQPELRFGTAGKAAEYGWICCENHTENKDGGYRWTVEEGVAEPQGSLAEPGVDLFDKAHAGMIFYDSKCGIPLFKLGARPVHVWKAESNHYGWPSFRDEEVVNLYENVIEMYSGEVVSSCKTHLGRNMRDRDGNRYSVNLLCISGKMAKAAQAQASEDTSPAAVLEETTVAPP